MTLGEQPATEPVRLWRAGSREVLLDRPIVVGILNVTPDSFSDGGIFFSLDDAVSHAGRLVADGADIIDVGGESTRPGAVRITEDEELRRAIPVVSAVRERWPEIPISIDTTRATVASAALNAGADIINDVAAMRLDSEMRSVAASARCGVILMHSRGTVEEMATYRYAVYGDDPATEVARELGESARQAEAAGIPRECIVLDPGIGFSKESRHSAALIRHLPVIAQIGCPVMVGASRKRFIGEAIAAAGAAGAMAAMAAMAAGAAGAARVDRGSAAVDGLEDRDHGTVAANVIALERGAMLFRVHNARASRRALDVAWAILHGAGS